MMTHFRNGLAHAFARMARAALPVLAAAAIYTPVAEAQFIPRDPALSQTEGAETTSLNFMWGFAIASGRTLGGYIVHLRARGGSFGSDEAVNSLPSGVVIAGRGVTVKSDNTLEPTTFLQFTNLQPGTTYEARARVYATDNFRSAWTDVVHAETAPLPPITALALAASTGTTELRPAFDGNIMTYHATVAAAAANVTVTATFADSASIGLRGATAATLTSGAASGNVSLSAGANIVDIIAGPSGDKSTYTLFVTRADTAPLAPRDLGLLPPSPGQLTLTWRAPPADGLAITDYLVRWALGAGSTKWINTPGGKDGESAGGGDMMHTIPGLQNGTTYDVQIAAVNSAGAGDFSESVSGATPAVMRLASSTLSVSEATSAQIGVVLTPAQLERKIALLNLTAVSATEGVDYMSGPHSVSILAGLTFVTTPIRIAGDEALVEHDEVFRATLGKDDASDTSFVIGDPASIEVTIIDEDRKFAGIAFGADASSSTALTFTFTATIGEADGTLTVPVSISHAPGEAAVFTIETSGSASGGTNGDYTITATQVTFPANADEAARTQNVVITVSNDALSEADEEIVLRIRAADDPVDDLGDYYTRYAAARITIDSDEVPGAPSNLRTTPDVGLLTLTWTAPSDNGGSEITGYAVRWAEGNDVAPIGDGEATRLTDTTYVLRGLKSATTYEVQVAAVNIDGRGDWSATAEGVTTAFDLDVNQSGGAADWRDGVLIARYLAGVRGAALTAGPDSLGAGRAVADVAAHIEAGVQNAVLDIDIPLNGVANGVTAADGIMLARYLMGVTGAALTAGQSDTMPEKVIENIKANIGGL